MVFVSKKLLWEGVLFLTFVFCASAVFAEEDSSTGAILTNTGSTTTNSGSDVNTEIDTIAPGEVINLTAVSGISQVDLTWQNPVDDDFDHVYLNCGTVLSENIGTGTGYVLLNLIIDQTYNCVVQTVDLLGNTSTGVAVIFSLEQIETVQILYFNEILINPLEGKEWLEIYNASTGTASLAGYQIFDAVKKRYTFSSEDVLGAQSFLTLEFYNVFNNDGDQVYLKNAQDEIIDQISYGDLGDTFQTVEKGQSLGRSPNGSENWMIYSADETTKNAANLVYYQVQMTDVAAIANVASGTLVLSWNPVADTNLFGYRIFQRHGVDLQLLATTDKNIVSYQINNLVKGNIYEFQISPCNQTGACTNSENSATVIVADFLGLQLNEIMANAVGSDTGNEWIEILNTSTGSIALEKYYLKTSGSKIIELNTFGSISSGEYLTINPGDFGVTLKNSNDAAALWHTDFSLALDSLEYITASDGQSWRRNLETNNWEENFHPTRNAENILWNTNPVAIITIQGTGKTEGEGTLSVNVTAENSIDADSDLYTYFWDYGDGTISNQCNPASHKYSVGNFQLTLTITDSLGGISFANQSILVRGKSSSGGGKNTITVPIILQASYTDKIIINELFPNPAGKDSENEWIELYNQSQTKVDLTSWKLDDAEGGSKPYVIPQNTFIQPHGFLLLRIQDTGLTLNNGTDDVRLFDPRGNLKDSVVYNSVQEDQSFQRQKNQTWFWLPPTPLAKNQELQINNFNASLEIYAVLPNPTGVDKNKEWLQLFNPSQNTVNLTGWQIQTRKKSFTFSDVYNLSAQQKLKIFVHEINLTLTNNYEELFLLNPQGQTIDKLIWRDALSGRIYKHQINLDNHQADDVRVTRIVDGDTFVVNFSGQKEKVRLIGIDTPETVHPHKLIQKYGLQASSFAKKHLLGKTVTLKYDETKRDKYGRILAYVYLHDGSMFNKNLLLEGYAWAYLRFPFKHREEFIRAEQLAQKQQKGIWKQTDKIKDILETILQEKEEQSKEKTEELVEQETENEETAAENMEENFQVFDFSTIQISEIYPNTVEGDRENEWIEIKNLGAEDVNLAGWSLDDEIPKGSRPYFFTGSTIIPARGFLLAYSKQTKLALNNDGDTVNLINPYGVIQDKANFKQTKKGYSWARNSKNRFILTAHKTPLKENIMMPPRVKKDTDYDGISDEDEINYYHTDPNNADTDGDGAPDGFEIYNGTNPIIWDSEQSQYQEYLKAITIIEFSNQKTLNNEYVLQGKTEPNAIVRLFIHSDLIVGVAKADESGEWSYQLNQKLEQGSHHVETEVITASGFKTKKYAIAEFNLDADFEPKQYSTKIKINSLMPNPEGRDTEKEFFILRNEDKMAVNLENWQIQNQNGKTFSFSQIVLAPGEFKQFSYPETKLTLNNSKGFLLLFNPQGKRTDFLSYNNVHTDEIFTHEGGNKQIKKPSAQKVRVKNIKYDTHEEISGMVLSDINTKLNIFWFKTEDDIEIRAKFNQEQLPPFLAEIYFKKGNKLILVGNFVEDNLFQISDFVSIAQMNTKSAVSIDKPYMINNTTLLCFLFCLGGVYYYVRKRIFWSCSM